MFGLSLILFGFFAVQLRDFVLDDAYIAFHYADHLTAGQGLVWNTGEAPVEGFTSLLWVLLIAGFRSVSHLDAAIVAKWLGVTFGVLSALMVARELAGVTTSGLLVFLFPLTLSPAFAYLASQGMETSLAVLLFMLLTKETLTVDRQPSFTESLRWTALAFLCLLVRPDSGLFIVGLLLGWVVNRSRDRVAENVRGRAVGIGLLAALLTVFLGWKFVYFGQLLPTTFYVKQAGCCLIKGSGLEYLASFGLAMLLPYVLAFAILNRVRAALATMAPASLGPGAQPCPYDGAASLDIRRPQGLPPGQET